MEIDDEIEKCIPRIVNSLDERDKEDISASLSDNSAKRQMKKSDTGVSDESFKRKKMNDNDAYKGEGDSLNLPESSETSRSEAPSEKGDGFPKMTSNFKSRNYRKRNSTAEDKASSEEESHSNPLMVNSNILLNDINIICNQIYEFCFSNGDQNNDKLTLSV